ncbi:CubicO group peptidase, beta-lactamase class C family [Dyella jiangningensis]|nr:CubicO group peptidase (beta-lactamase class C family) [Dyella sp. AtDHG13]SDJ72327.1 CubicO group peptidase, beta-lactamase class C family [Dyella jiangningensis]
MVSRRRFVSGMAGTLVGAWLAPSLLATDAATTKGVRATVDDFVKANNFQGVIHLVRNQRVLLSEAFGMADVEAGRRATVDTLYPLASITKWIVSVTVLRLVDQGRLALNGSIVDYLTDYRPDTGARVKLKHLLSNSSGIPNGFTPLAKIDPGMWTKSYTTDEAIKAFCSGDLAFEPGSRFSYDLTNWILVKGIVERVTGKDFAAAIDTLSLAPLGLEHVLPRYTEEARAQVAAGYASIEPPIRKMNPQLAYMVASGGYCGTATDLVRAAEGVYGASFLSAASREALSTILVPTQSYALGGRIRKIQVDGTPHDFAWETGRLDGYRSLLAHRLDGQTSLVLLNNTDLSQKTIDLFAEAMFAATPQA